jgi:hypothetical protein
MINFTKEAVFNPYEKLKSINGVFLTAERKYGEIKPAGVLFHIRDSRTLS